jgi:hypothetical protein
MKPGGYVVVSSFGGPVYVPSLFDINVSMAGVTNSPTFVYAYALLICSNRTMPTSGQTTTAFAVDTAPATPTPQPTQQPSMADLYFVPGIIGVIIAIIVVGAVLLLALRKRP